MTAACPACRRPVAMARPRCVYCGAALPAETLAALAAGRAAEAPPDAPSPAAPSRVTARALVLVDLARAAAEPLAAALGLSSYEAELKVRRGGVHVHRAAPAPEAEREAASLLARGLDVMVVPEEEVRAAPLMAAGGGPEDGRLRLRTEGAEERLAGEDLLLVVKGTIAREYQTPTTDVRRLPVAGLAAGARVHLHLRRGGGPIEIDPAEFAFDPGADVVRGAEGTIAAWIAETFPAVPVDEAFRWLTPALAPAGPPAGTTAALARPAKGARVVLDNLAQFRFYSGVRAAAARRRRG